ncbi:hotdog fold thioesterase [Virgibacillus halodenitrificans]|uniref:Esterase n=1 Tax=Virgibacillus halodenitrificans TaxID=1482 RepID=A0AAC9J0K4_VIRHA|nr:hotdog fold thioesterase [Virgibacillus halodenitrificans]APC48902.1 esterase [Virgibacillus halodenitrificans]MCG1030195.1 hotdog fold thioesterase [Virgibacillus halodenitrificans]MCJ0933309.1 hotdog fold thioesterase [Virgibacillus halodenitrificans]MEC2161108.1 hotdog fold thioesterase [Virgibacillus halodenitrificans]CDQ30673.1 Putative esterase [Virgibacillus halodenitrificans]
MHFKSTLMDALGMELISLDKNLVKMTMPVDERTHQPAGYLHGGANAALAETAASIGAFAHIDTEKSQVFGIEINANHIKSKKSGLVTAEARPLHIGKSTMVWEIKIMDEEQNLLCISRCTIGIISK